jgi:hypothetical protein
MVNLPLDADGTAASGLTFYWSHLHQRTSMSIYKIKIIRRHLVAEQEVDVRTDYAAIQYGRQSCSPGETVQVYRSDECIYLTRQLGCVSAH